MTTFEYDLAKWLHEQYEEISQEANWTTQKKCQVKFINLPVENKAVMIEMAKRIVKRFDIR